MVTVSADRLRELLRPEPAPGEPRRGATYRLLAESLRLLIVDGRVPLGTRLPSERTLAETLGVSRTTVTGAYALLRVRGYADSRQGAGTTVRLPSRSSTDPVPLAGPIVPGDAPAGLIDLSVAALPAPPGIRAAYEAAMDELPGILTGSGYHPLGLEPLRQALADRYTRRGLPTTPDQIMVTSGAMPAIALVAATLLSPGERVVVETPSWPNTVETFRLRGARVLPTVVEPSGWDIPALAAQAASNGARLMSLTPDFHNPTGALMTQEQRAELADRLHAGMRGGEGACHVLADETLADFPAEPHRDLPLPFAASFPGAILVGGASKSHWGGLRIGWLRVPTEEHRPGLLPQLARVRLGLDLGTPPLEQVALTLMLSDEAIPAYQRDRVARTRTAAQEAVWRHLPGWRAPSPDGGLSLWCELPAAGPRAGAVAEAAERQGVRVGIGPRFAVEGGYDRFVRLGCTLGGDAVTEGIRRLAAALADPGSPAPHTPIRHRPVLV